MHNVTSSSALPKLPRSWAREWEARNSMALFVAQDGDWCKIFAVNKETRQVYHVVDFLQHDHDFDGMDLPACSLLDGKLYLVGDRHPGDVHICDLTNFSPPPYSWKQGPPMHSTKHLHHLVPFHGLLFVISNLDPINMNSPFSRDEVVAHDPVNKPIFATFEVLDTKKDAPQWEVLPDPPFPDRGYKVISYTVFNDLIYFVFDRERSTSTSNFKYDDVDMDEDEETDDDCIDSKVLAFDPRRRQWLAKLADYEPTFRWYIDLAAHCTQGGNRMVYFVDPSLRCFLMDPPRTPGNSVPIPPCFYTFDYSSWNHHPNFNPLPQALIKYMGSSSNYLKNHEFLKWFQIYVRPYLFPVVGLSDVMEGLVFENYRHCHSFFLPSYHYSEQDGEHWSVCLVSFLSQTPCFSCDVSTFKVVKTSFNLFEAKDVKIHVQDLTNISYPRRNRSIPKLYQISCSINQ